MVVDPLSAWLSSDELIGEGGHCLSWVNPAHPGYAYPELSGLLLSLLVRSGSAPARARQLHDALCVGASPDGVRRGATTYAFDTAMALRGVLEHRGEQGAGDFPAREWTATLVEAVGSGRGCAPAPPWRADTRWSLAFGAHEAKLAGALVPADRLGLPGAADAVDRLRDGTVALQEPDGRFRVHALSPLTYLHAHCYAVEGLLMAGGADEAVRAGVAWLAQVQRPDGGFPAWAGPYEGDNPLRTDVTAQAVRLFRLVDPTGYASEVAAGSAFLLSCVHPDGGVRYEPGSEDRTAWPTIFAAQALAPDGHVLRAVRGSDLV
ncbi:hypothetical protein GCM10022197_13610 [Microlunatus spumicola]|uniref:Prenyltransferase n=2 Tax=Microlunatus spumicola TaxID=81499 RepID=A0ABP6X4J9_9ACTN